MDPTMDPPSRGVLLPGGGPMLGFPPFKGSGAGLAADDDSFAGDDGDDPGEEDDGDDEDWDDDEDDDDEDEEDEEEADEVDEASQESFPASDPPAFTPLHIGS
jgi:hypothetical protein